MEIVSTINVAVTGYYASGSSAVIDLLKEYEGVCISPYERYEHIAFYAPGGLFDLGAILRFSNTPYNSDAAIGRFINEMNRLNENDFGGFGSYEKLTGQEFIRSVNSFVDSISNPRMFRGSCHVDHVKFSVIKAVLQIAAKIVFGRPINKLGRQYVYDHLQPRMGLPTNEEFCNAARQFTSAYISLFETNEVTVFDHLLWPQNIKYLYDYFDSRTKMIIVNRDPRDVFLLNKYFLHNPPRVLTKPYFPTDVVDFCKEWQRTIVNQEDNNDRVLVINFEDLIYQSEKTNQTIEKFLGIDASAHTQKCSFFNPNESIENTQIFSVDNAQWQQEANYIEQHIPEMIYRFPYFRQCDSSKWFDNPDVDVKRKRKNE